jgi:hypothetical protein
VRWTIGAWLAVLVILACTQTRPPLAFTPTELEGAHAGRPYLATISVQQNATPVGAMSISSGELPPGLELTFLEGSDAGEITGTPAAAGTYVFTVEVWCFGTNVNGQTGSATYTLVVS